jgi:hypothetical protein
MADEFYDAGPRVTGRKVSQMSGYDRGYPDKMLCRQKLKYTNPEKHKEEYEALKKNLSEIDTNS